MKLTDTRPSAMCRGVFFTPGLTHCMRTATGTKCEASFPGTGELKLLTFYLNCI